MRSNCLINNIYTSLFVVLLSCQFSLAQNASTDSLATAMANVEIANKLTLSGYPYVYYTPETSLAFGLGGIMIFYGDDGVDITPSKVTFSGQYTTTKQYKISLKPSMYFLDNKLFIGGDISLGYYIDKYWGAGNNTIDTGTEEYSKQGISAIVKIQSPPLWFSADRSGFVFEFDQTTMKDKMDNSHLNSDTIPGSNGGTLYGFGIDLTWDTRDNIFFPNSGGYQYFKFIIYPDIGAYTFGNLELDIRHYVAFKKDHVLAMQFYTSNSFGETPFYKLPAMGGQYRMRGYFEGRYRDNFYAMTQFEYRQYFWKRFGFAVFGGLGNVSSEVIKYDFSSMKYSYGGGLRFLFNREHHVNLRMDIGIGEDGNSGVYFSIEEAF